MVTSLSKDINELSNIFPKLKYSTRGKNKFIKGEIDICDVKGNYLKTFSIAVLVPKTYPYGVPILIELSDIIPREDKRHINKEGVCCVEMDHILLYEASQGIRIIDFIRNKVYPYLANQLYYKEMGQFSNGEYKHGFEGVKQFYKEKLKISSNKLAIQIIKFIVDKRKLERNLPCTCGSGKKIKHCHWYAFNYLKSVGKQRLLIDLKEFENQ